jgi:hypothetical protein
MEIDICPFCEFIDGISNQTINVYFNTTCEFDQAWMQKTRSRNRRQHKRRVMSGMVEYSVFSSFNKGFNYGIISDMSVLGMRLLTTSPLKRGDKIVFKTGNTTPEIAVVLWSDIGAFYYKAGLKFEELT